jgi:hypothetical protein
MIEAVPRAHLAKNVAHLEKTSPVAIEPFMHLQTTRPFHPGSFVAWFLTRQFGRQDGEYLKRIISFPLVGPKADTSIPVEAFSWARNKTQIVIPSRLRYNESRVQRITHDGEENEEDVLECIPLSEENTDKVAPPWGYRAETEDDVRAWLEQELKEVAFCICPLSCMPHLIFLTKSSLGYVWVFLRFSKETTRDGLLQERSRYKTAELFTVRLYVHN